MNYRPEIDGLRALAIVPVILFHAGFRLFGGGFVGVDIFFVISGYLITTILVEDLENDRFSIVRFYERRARRILPALLLVVFLCVPAAWWWMPPDHMRAFSQTIVAVSIFASNIFFWIKNDYFGATAQEIPLLHTWSLAVEEQFYFIFPIFLYSLWRLSKRKLFLIVSIVTLSIFVASEIGWRYAYQANFYLLPGRCWELLAGSLAALAIQKRGIRPNNILSISGISAILFAIFYYDESTPFPSIYALTPVIGAILLLLFAGEKTIAARMLSNKAMVAIGLISYSAYLWHQPLFAFTRILSADTPTSMVMVALVLLVAMLATISWKFIEQPFRIPKTSPPVFLAFLVAVISFIGILGHERIFKSRLQYKFDEISSRYGDSSWSGDDGYDWIVRVEQPQYLLVGDSHAKQYYGALQHKLGTVSLFSHSACLSLPQENTFSENRERQPDECLNLYKQYLAYIRENPSITTIFFAHRWVNRFWDSTVPPTSDGREADVNPQILDQLRILFSLIPSNITIVVIGNVPTSHVAESHMSNGFVYCMAMFNSGCPLEYNKELREGQKINSALSGLEMKFNNLRFFDPAETLCTEKMCKIVKDQSLVYSDRAHLTKFGANAVIEGIFTKLPIISSTSR